MSSGSNFELHSKMVVRTAILQTILADRIVSLNIWFRWYYSGYIHPFIKSDTSYSTINWVSSTGSIRLEYAEITMCLYQKFRFLMYITRMPFFTLIYKAIYKQIGTRNFITQTSVIPWLLATFFSYVLDSRVVLIGRNKQTKKQAKKQIPNGWKYGHK